MTIQEHAAALVAEYDAKYKRIGPYLSPAPGVVYPDFKPSVEGMDQLKAAVRNKRGGTWTRGSSVTIQVNKGVVNPTTGQPYSPADRDALVGAIDTIYDGMWLVIDPGDPNYEEEWDNLVIVLD